MTDVLLPPPSLWTATYLAERFGPLPLARVRLAPSPGRATEQDVIDLHDRENRLFELVDGILLELYLLSVVLLVALVAGDEDVPRIAAQDRERPTPDEVRVLGSVWTNLKRPFARLSRTI